ncbi:hypothetical protein AB0B01_30665, partial [Streptomyces sp. NPDC044571]|uniref:hypothetical protein n=1 Tax=Streptomyces sp. NPDC044571 TaxID=3155371 RepID=UPI0033EC6F5C
ARLDGVLRVHPPLDLRLRALDDERALSGVSFWDLCAVGAAVAFVQHIVGLGPIGGGTLDSPAIDALASALASALLVGATGTVLWRACASERGGAPHVREAGLGLGAGLCAVQLLSPTDTLFLAMLGGRGLSVFLPYSVLLGLCAWALAAWLAVVARQWTPVLERARRPRLLMGAVLGVAAAGAAPALDFLFTLPMLMIYGATFVFPSVPTVVGFVGGTFFLVGRRPESLVIPVLLTGALIPLAGRYAAERQRRSDPRTGFGPPLPRAGRAVRLGVPLAFATALPSIVLPLFGLRLSPWDPLPLIGLAQLGAAVWATRDYAPLRLARALVAAFSTGVLSLLAWFVLARLLTTCLPGLVPGPCRPLPGLGQLRVVLVGSADGAALAWLLFTAAVALGGARLPRRRRAAAARTGDLQGPGVSNPIMRREERRAGEGADEGER